MPIPESQFEVWKKTGADKGSKEASDKIERLLRLDRSPAEQSDGNYDIRRQGSYKNHTYTRGSSDVDIIAKLTSAWSRDLSALSDEDRERYERHHSSADYGYDEFSQDVWQWLTKKFDYDVISWSGKAIEISRESGRINVDVDLVPCVEHRRYTSYPSYGEGVYDTGMAFHPRSSTEKIVNYPGIHYDNGCGKHGNYKETVRIFKNARDHYNDYFDTVWTIGAHSYGIECLIYNVPDSILKRSSRSDRFVEVLEFLGNADLSTFDQVSEMEKLFGSSNTQWDISEAETLIDRLAEMWNDWYDKRKNAQLLH
ncbi:nucleotidyltransferase domain-containing protein [Natronorubrum sp. DTA7]|uniref:nucleotidyltransferase domain-containing protein n=1 Tax=Natronorubrum sp. DTA7 TaxID=3447016 RepID=UPI003F8462CA